MTRFLWFACVASVGMLWNLLGDALCTPARALVFPGPDPGPARGQITEGQLTLENEILACRWSVAQDRLRPERFADKLSGTALSMTERECFQIVLADSPSPVGRIVRASDMALAGPPQVQTVEPNDRATRLADRLGGRQIVVRLADADSGLQVEWRAILRDGSNYVQFRLTLGAAKIPLEVKEIIFWELAAGDARVMGTVDGAPVAAGTMFFACEHPMAKSELLGEPAADGTTRFRCCMPCQVLVRPGEPVCYTSIAGVTPQGQLRRGFLYYLERERAHPYRPLLHYNNGSEIGCEYWRRQLHKQEQEAAEFRRDQQQTWLDNIRAFGEQLVVKRGVTMDAFVHDFEWDDETLVWQFHEGYPEGFGPAQKAAEQFGARVGVWLSPAGGYPGKPARMQRGRQEGFEINPNGLSLAGPRYYARVRTACANMVQRYGVNYFKYDGFGAGNNQPGSGPYGSDVEALLRLMTELRKLKPDIFFNPSTGTWPSPFWLKYADSIWRQGSDTNVLGKGSDRQKWITYRDSEIYHGVLDKSPLYPISSLMIHGVFVNALPLFGNPYDPTAPRPTYDPAEITAEIRSFFGTGTNLQELYIAPPLMTERTWDTLAEAARWSRSNADVLTDTHWVGGDPAKTQVYGWASWSKRKGILTLRNPDDRAAEMTVDIGQVFELPPNAVKKFSLRSPWKEDADKAPIELTAGQPKTLTLHPFEVLVFDAVPVQ